MDEQVWPAVKAALTTAVDGPPAGIRLTKAGLTADLPGAFSTIGSAAGFRRGRSTEDLRDLASRVASRQGRPSSQVLLRDPVAGGRPVPAIVFADQLEAEAVAVALWPAQRVEILG